VGTNYYLKKKACECCGLRDDTQTIHVGKSSYGWSFSFHGIPGKIESEKDWKKKMEDESFELVNEYGEVVDHKWFWELVDNKRDDKNHTKYCREDDEGFSREHGYRDCWYDDETGSSFSKGEFS
jgi:hypothetical protein